MAMNNSFLVKTMVSVAPMDLNKLKDVDGVYFNDITIFNYVTTSLPCDPILNKLSMLEKLKEGGINEFASYVKYATRAYNVTIDVIFQTCLLRKLVDENDRQVFRVKHPKDHEKLAKEKDYLRVFAHTYAELVTDNSFYPDENTFKAVYAVLERKKKLMSAAPISMVVQELIMKFVEVCNKCKIETSFEKVAESYNVLRMNEAAMKRDLEIMEDLNFALSSLSVTETNSQEDGMRLNRIRSTLIQSFLPRVKLNEEEDVLVIHSLYEQND